MGKDMWKDKGKVFPEDRSKVVPVLN
jgi:hypothetical protein